MHYCLMLFTKEFPTKEKIDRMMKRYRWENNHPDNHDEYPQFTYDWYEIGGRYNGLIKLKVDFEDEKYRWKFYTSEPRNGRMFWSYLLSDLQKHEKPFIYDETRYLFTMGARDDFLYVDGAWIADTTNFDEQDCYTFMTDDGEAYSREWWNGEDFIPNDDFEERLKSAKDRAKEENQFLTIIDYHD